MAGPFAGTILAYFGAEVIKVEPPRTGDPVRVWRLMEDGTSLWWRSLGRNKKCITLDLPQAGGARRWRGRSRARSTFVIENFPAGHDGEVGARPQDVERDNPGVVYCRVSGYGQTGPYAHKPGYASVCEGVGRLPLRERLPRPAASAPELSLGDSLAGLHAALGIVMALYNRDGRKAGRARAAARRWTWAIYEAVFNMMEAWCPSTTGWAWCASARAPSCPGSCRPTPTSARTAST